MEWKILAVGDVVGNPGLEHIRRSLRKLKQRCGADFVVVNGENASAIGIVPHQAEDILDAGADVITLGNHSFDKREICSYLDESSRILRPANYAPQVPGRGWAVYESKAGDIAVIDLIGRCGMDYGPDNPFLLVEKILKQITAKIILVELHAEATSEKLAMGFMLDGRVTAVWGTHTHVPTADVMVLPNGTGYVTDLGMTGPRDSVLGIRPELSVKKFRGDLTGRYEPAPGACQLNGCIFTVDAASGRCTAVERVAIHG